MLRAQQVNRESDVEMALSENVTVRVSDHDLGKVVEELVDNAFKFSESGTPISVTTSVEDGHYVLKVNNHGHGMTPEQIEAIGAYMQFNRWFYEQQGSGLGLAIAKRLTELYQGTLTIESIINEAVTVIVRLPLES
jgi:signal transduction histidine kinase